MSETPTDWVRHARWQLGEMTNGEYADALVAEGESEDDITIQILRRKPDGRMATPTKDTPMEDSTTPKTISIRPAARLVENAMAWAEVPLGDALKLNKDGTLSFDFEADDLQPVLSALTGLVLSGHATATMVLPSHVQVLQGVLGLLRELSAERLSEHGQRRLEDAVERLDGVIGNLDGLASK